MLLNGHPSKYGAKLLLLNFSNIPGTYALIMTCIVYIIQKTNYKPKNFIFSHIISSKCYWSLNFAYIFFHAIFSRKEITIKSGKHKSYSNHYFEMLSWSWLILWWKCGQSYWMFYILFIVSRLLYYHCFYVGFIVRNYFLSQWPVVYCSPFIVTSKINKIIYQKLFNKLNLLVIFLMLFMYFI